MMSVTAGLFSSAAQIMSTPVVTVGPDTTIQEAARLLEEQHVSGLPVVDANRQLLGMLTEFDLLRAVRDLQLQGRVGEFMSVDVVAVEELCPMADLIDLLIEKRIRRVPVVRKGRVVGVVSRRDLVFAGSVRQQLFTELPEAAVSPGQSEG